MGDDGSEMEEGLFELAESTSGTLRVPATPLLPSGLILLRDAVRNLCQDRGGASPDDMHAARFSELIAPVHTAVLNGWIKVICFPQGKPRRDVNPDAFVNPELWRGACLAIVSSLTQLEVGLEPGCLAVVEAEFRHVMSGQHPDELSELPSERYVPPAIDYALELVERFDLSPNYKFDRTIMKDAVIRLAQKERSDLKLDGDRAYYFVMFMGHPVFDRGGSGKGTGVIGDPAIEAARARGTNLDRPEDPTARGCYELATS